MPCTGGGDVCGGMKVTGCLGACDRYPNSYLHDAVVLDVFPLNRGSEGSEAHVETAQDPLCRRDWRRGFVSNDHYGCHHILQLNLDDHRQSGHVSRDSMRLHDLHLVSGGLGQWWFHHTTGYGLSSFH